MTKKDFSLIFCLLVIGILIGLCCRTCKAPVTHSFPGIDSAINRDRFLADSLLSEIDIKDHEIDLLRAHTDTIIKSTNKYIVRYQNSTDTIYKLMTCDSIIVGYGKLQKDYYKNDTLHLNIEAGLKQAIGYYKIALDTCQIGFDAEQKIIADKDKKIDRNRKVAWTAIGTTAVATLIAVLKK